MEDRLGRGRITKFLILDIMYNVYFEAFHPAGSRGILKTRVCRQALTRYFGGVGFF